MSYLFEGKKRIKPEPKSKLNIIDLKGLSNEDLVEVVRRNTIIACNNLGVSDPNAYTVMPVFYNDNGKIIPTGTTWYVPRENVRDPSSYYHSNVYNDFKAGVVLFFNNKEEQNIIDKLGAGYARNEGNPVGLIFKDNDVSILEKAFRSGVTEPKKNKWNDTRKENNSSNNFKGYNTLKLYKPGDDINEYTEYAYAEEKAAAQKLGLPFSSTSIASMFWDLKTGIKRKGGTWGAGSDMVERLMDYTLGSTPYNQYEYPVPSKVQAVVLFNSKEERERILGDSGYEASTIGRTVGAIICVPADQYNPSGVVNIKKPVKSVAQNQIIRDLRTISYEDFVDMLSNMKENDKRKIYIFDRWNDSDILNIKNGSEMTYSKPTLLQWLKVKSKSIIIKYDRNTHSFIILKKKQIEPTVW